MYVVYIKKNQIGTFGIIVVYILKLKWVIWKVGGKGGEYQITRYLPPTCKGKL